MNPKRITSYKKLPGEPPRVVDGDRPLLEYMHSVQQYDRKVEAAINALSEQPDNGLGYFNRIFARLKSPQEKSAFSIYYGVAATSTIIFIDKLCSAAKTTAEAEVVAGTLIGNPFAKDGIRILMNAGMNIIMAGAKAKPIFFTDSLKAIEAGKATYDQLEQAEAYYSYYNTMVISDDIQYRKMTTKDKASERSYCAFDHASRAFMGYINGIAGAVLPSNNIGYVHSGKLDVVTQRMKEAYSTEKSESLLLQTIQTAVMNMNVES